MGLFKNIFGSSKPVQEKVLPWQPLTELSQLDEIAQKSQKKTQVIFKHSTTCGISKMAMKQFVSDYDIDANLDLYYLDLLNYREVSTETGYKFQVIHQSPQLLIIKNGVVVAHDSHVGISDLDLQQFV
jgi:bacillithiol system protein YtxJ